MISQNKKDVAASTPSSQMAHLLDKKGKLFSNAELIRLCLITAVEDVCPEKNHLRFLSFGEDT